MWVKWLPFYHFYIGFAKWYVRIAFNQHMTIRPEKLLQLMWTRSRSGTLESSVIKSLRSRTGKKNSWKCHWGLREGCECGPCPVPDQEVRRTRQPKGNTRVRVRAAACVVLTEGDESLRAVAEIVTGEMVSMGYQPLNSGDLGFGGARWVRGWLKPCGKDKSAATIWSSFFGGLLPGHCQGF